MSIIYERGHDMHIDGNTRMNIRCERESCVILCEMTSLSLQDVLCFCSGFNDDQFFVRVGLCISCVLASNPSQATTFLV
jgi:hypothetical protein